MKYKPCCGRRCLLYRCETQESGGCSCVCRLVDAPFIITAMHHNMPIPLGGSPHEIKMDFKKRKDILKYGVMKIGFRFRK
jgi:hypothetical protein